MRLSKIPWFLWLTGGVVFLAINLSLETSQLQKSGEVVTSLSPASIDFRTFSGDATVESGEIFENSLGMKFTSVPDLRISFGIHEVTRRSFLKFAEEVKLQSVRPASHLDKVDCWTDSKTRDGLEYRDDHPIVSVSWEEATYFCEWLSNRDNLFYRLATDFEWSHAVGLEGETAYHSPSKRASECPEQYVWGKRWEDSEAIGNFADTAYHKHSGLPDCFPFSDGYAGTAPVMRFRPNQLGIYDMGGNVSEWVYDWFRGRDEFKTIRGASYRSGAAYSDPHKLGFRTMGIPGFRSDHVGFRIVVEHDERFLAKVSAAPGKSVIPPPFISGDGGASSPSLAASVDRKRVRITYGGSDGVNIRHGRNFDDSGIQGALLEQDITTVEQIGDMVVDGDETWVKLEVSGWMPVSAGNNTFLEKEGDGWKVVWNRKNDRFVAMRSYPNSDSTLVAKVNYGTVVEELESKTVSGRPYILARLSGWCVKENRSKTYVADD